MKKLLSVLFLVLLFTPLRAHADACAKDRTTTCGDVPAGEGHVYDCLVGRQDKVTPECASAVNRATTLADGVISACKTDAERWCAQYTGGRRGAE